MKRTLKSVLAVTSVAAIAGAGLLAIAPAANAATPAWEPDAANSVGQVVLYDSAGHVLTGGSDLSHLADYAAATGGPDANATKAQLRFAAPDSTKPDPSSWFTGNASLSTNTPNAAAPAPISGTAGTNPGGVAFTKPLVTLGAADANLNNFMATATLDTSAGYNNVFTLRIVDSGPSCTTCSGHYWQSDILIDPVAGTWTMAYPTIATTTTTLTGVPAGDGGNVVKGASSETLTATVSPASNGTVQIFDGASVISTQAVTTADSSVDFVTGDTNAAIHSYTATFTPDGGTAVKESTSSGFTVTYTDSGVDTAVSLAGGATSAQYQPYTLTATVSEADAPVTDGLAGNVVFKDGASTIGNANTDAGGVATFVTTSLAQGSHSITAVFTPSISSYSVAHPTFYNSSTSSSVIVSISAPSCGGGGTPGGDGTTFSGVNCTEDDNIHATVDAGSLTLTTPYTGSNFFDLGHLVLDPTGSMFTSGGKTFPATTDAPIIVHSSLAQNPNWTLSVAATDLTCNACSGSPKPTLSGTGLGLTAGQVVTGVGLPTFPSNELIQFTDNASVIPGQSVTPTSHGLLAGATPFTFAQTITDATHTGGNGSVALRGTLTLLAPSNSVAGLYTGTITFSVN